MSPSDSVRFYMRGRYYQADRVAAVVQKDENTVEIRYLDHTPNVQITDSTVERVVMAIDKAKAAADSA